MSNLCMKIASGDYNSIKASNLRALFRKEFSRNEQHDANEFIVSLFEKLQDEQTPKSITFISDNYKSGK